MIQRIQLVVQFGGFLCKPSGLLGVFRCQLRVALLQFCNFLALGFNDVVVLLPAGPAAIDGFGLHLQPVFTADCEQKITAQMIEGHLSVIGSAGLLRRVRQRDAQGFQRLFLLGFPFAVAVFDIEHLPGVNMGTGLVQMQRPVQHMDVGAEALFHRCKKRQHHVSQHLGRRAVALFSDLVDGFFRANARIPQQIVNGSIALGMTGFGVALVLPRNKRPVPALIFVPLVLGEGREAAVLLMGAQAVCAVPVQVQPGSLPGDVLRILHVEAAIVVPGVIDAVFSRAAIVTGYPLLLIGDGRSPPSLLLGCLFPWRSCFRSPEELLFRQVIPSTKCRTPSGRFAFNTSLGHGRCPLDSRQALPPCTRPRGVAP